MWRTPVFDRTEADVLIGTDKGYLNIADLQRIEDNIVWIAEEMNILVTAHVWRYSDFITLTHLMRLHQNMQGLLNRYHVLPSTPNLPVLPWIDWEDYNDLEQILNDLYNLWENNKKSCSYTGEVHCGYEIGVI